MSKFVILRPANVKTQKGETKQYIHGHEVLDNVGEFGGIILDEIVQPDHPNWPLAVAGGKKEWIARRVIRKERQWSPTSCPNCGIVFDEQYVKPGAEKPIRMVCAECHKAIAWTSRELFHCEPVKWDAERLVASQSTEPAWTYVEVRSQAQLDIYTGGEPEDPKWDDAKGDDTADQIEERAVEGANKLRSNVPESYRTLQAKVAVLLEHGAPADELSHGKVSPTGEMESFISKYIEQYGPVPASTV